MTRIVFFGSPDYAVPSLRACLDLEDADVVAVVTQPDRPRGRSGRAQTTPVTDLAREAGVSAILQPERLRRDTTETLLALGPDLGVVAASGHILPGHLLEVFPHAVLNVHASLLPRHRGASPVAAAILAGDAETGSTIMRVVRELDAGPIVAQESTPIGARETAGVLTDRLAVLGADLLARTIPRWVAGALTEVAQDASLATYAPRLVKSDGVIDWSRPAVEVARAVRAFHPWPLATTTYREQTFAIHEAWPLPETASAAPGTVLDGDSRALAAYPGRTARAAVACGSGTLVLLAVQRAGRRVASIEDFLNGDRAFIGARLE